MTSFKKPHPESSEQLQDTSPERASLKKISLEELRRKYDLPETNVLIISPFPLRKK
jgi:hypothetical protein